jgi:glycosyltransferase involved in cell wall biosynthesis
VAWFRKHLADRDVLVTNVGKDNRTAGLGARLAGVPVAHRVGGPGDLTGRAAVRWAHRHIVSAVVVPSESTRRALLAHPWIGEEDVTVIPNGVDLDVFRPGTGLGKLRALVGADPSDLLMVTTGQLTALKGHRFLLRALARLGGETGAWRLAVIGKGPEEERLESLAMELGIADRVHFAGFRRDVHELLEDADLALQPSTTEGLPHSVVEFMAKGKAVVASRLDGIMEAVEEGVTGVLVPPGSPEELARAIADLRARPETRRDMGRAARRRAEAQFGLDVMLDRVEAFLERASRTRRAFPR